MHIYNFWILVLMVAFSTFPPLSTNLSKKIFQGASCTFLLLYHFISFWKRVLQSALQCEFFFSEYLFHIHVFQNHNVDWEKKPTKERVMSSYTSYCAVCLSHPFFPFPVKSCKKFKADEVYCWRKKLFLKIKVKKNFYSALLLKKDYSTINLVLEKAGKTPFACTILCLLFLEWLFVNLILIEKISTLSYEQEKNFIISESRIPMELRSLTQTSTHSHKGQCYWLEL